jgi:hypothetical protein
VAISITVSKDPLSRLKKALPSRVLIAISPRSKDAVVGILPATALRFNFNLLTDICMDPF